MLPEPSSVRGWTIDSPGLDIELPASFTRKVLDQTQKSILTELYMRHSIKYQVRH